MDRETDEPALAGLLGGDKRLHGAIWGKDGFQVIFVDPDFVELPEIDVVGLHALEDGVKFLFSALQGTRIALCGDEYLAQEHDRRHIA